MCSNNYSIIRVYKSANDCLIVMDIDLSIAKTNLSRKVFDKKYAKYRCDQAKVIKIYKKNYNSIVSTEQEIDKIYSDYDPNFIYVKGKNVHVTDYDNIHANVCTKGIHFYLTKEAAYYHLFTIINDFNGIYKKWYDDGQIYEKCNYINGKIHGLYEKRYANEQLKKKGNYVNGILEGLYETWHENGQLKTKCNYINDKKME